MTLDRIEDKLTGRVPLLDLTRQVTALKPELMDALERVIDSGHYILREEVEAFEAAVAAYVGTRHAVGVASGTDALLLALKALDVGRGDLVVTTPFTFFATASAIMTCGATPVFVDVDPRTLNLDANQVKLVLEGRSRVHSRLRIRPEDIRAIVPVHLYGQPADMDPLIGLARERGLGVVEDAAQALGAEYRGRKAGSFSACGCFSFFPSKNLGAFGDGGIVVTSDDDVAQRVRRLRAHGANGRYRHDLIGTNSRLDAIQAALLGVKLGHLDDWILARQKNASAYEGALCGTEGLELPPVAPERTHTYHQYTLQVVSGVRDALRDWLGGVGVGTEIYYPTPLHLQPALERLGYRPGDFENAEAASTRVLSIPVYPELRSDELEHVAWSIQGFFHSAQRR